MPNAFARPEVQSLATRLSTLLSGGKGIAVALWGEPGLGKSWTAHELLRHMSCRSVTIHANALLAPLAAALPHPPKLPTWVGHALERLECGEALTSEAVSDVLSALLSALAPFVLHLEDLHEASSEKLELWQTLAGAVTRSRGVAVLATSRRPPPAPFEAQLLTPLSPEAASTLLETDVGAPLPPEALVWIYERACGNPLFSLEYLRYLVRQGYLWSNGRHWRWRTPQDERLPTSAEALVARFIHTASLSFTAELVMQARAILPLETSDQLWAEVSGISYELLHCAQRELEQKGILRQGRFVHPLYREVEERNLSREQRRIFAKRTVNALADEDSEAATAFLAQAELPADEALALLQHAAEDARARGSKQRAAELLAQAVRYASGEAYGVLALSAAKTLRHYNLAEALRLAEVAFTTLPEEVAVRLEYAELLSLSGRGDRAAEILAPLEGNPGYEEWLERLLNIRAEQEDFAGVLALWREHPDIQRVAELETVRTVAFSFVRQGDLEGAEALITRVATDRDLSLSERAAVAGIRSTIHFFRADLHEAEKQASLAIGLLRGTGSPREIAMMLSKRPQIRWGLGDYEGAVSDLTEILTLCSEIGDGRGYAINQALLGSCMLELGRYERAEELFTESRAVLERASAQSWLASCEGGLAQLYLEWPTAHSGALALRHAERGLRAARTTGSPITVLQQLPIAAWAEARFGTPQRASALAEEALELAKRVEIPRSAAMVQWVRGFALEALQQPEEALAAFEKAVDSMSRLGLDAWAMRMGLEVDRLRRDPETARERLNFFKAHGLQNGVNIAQRYFANSAPPVSPEKRETFLHIAVLGPMQLSRNGESVKYRTTKGRELLAYLLEARLDSREDVPQLELQDVLYPDMNDANAAGALQQLVYRLRGALGSGVILRTAQGYSLGAVASDAEAFVKTGEAKLWRGPYLEEFGFGWNVAVQDSLTSKLRLKVSQLLETNPVEAARLGRILLKHEPYSRPALNLTLRALRLSGNRKSLLKLYGECCTRFAEVGDELPPSWQDFLPH